MSKHFFLTGGKRYLTEEVIKGKGEIEKAEIINIAGPSN